MNDGKKKLTTWEAACIITGYGLGAGVLSMPYLAEKNGILTAGLILVVSLIASYVLHMMIAEIAVKNGSGGQIISCLERFLWRGKAAKFLSAVFFVLMAAILVTNLAAYITGSADVLEDLLGIPPLAAEIVFYVIAAAIVLFGLKAVGISESITVLVIFGLVAVLAATSLLNIRNPLRMEAGTFNQALAYFGMAMFAMSAFFSVPQAAEGLKGDMKKIRKAVFIGILNNFILIVVVTVCALLSSVEITEVAMVGWSKGIGTWAHIIGSIFTILAMLTTYWSLSLALGGIVEDALKLDHRLSWVIATLPSMILACLNLTDFMDLMRTAGGLIAIVVAIMVVPAYRNARKEVEGSAFKRIGGTVTQILVFLAYILMAVGSVVPV